MVVVSIVDRSVDFANKPLRATFGLRESGIAPTNKPPKARQRSGPFHWHVVVESTIDATTFFLGEISGCAAAARSSELDEGLLVAGFGERRGRDLLGGSLSF